MQQLRDFDDALNARLRQAAITTEIAWPNVSYVPTKGRPYLWVQNSGRQRTPLGFGADGVQQWTGMWQISAMVGRDSGTTAQAELAQKVLAAFPRGLNLPLRNGSPLIISGATAPVPIAFNDWSNQPVIVSWFALEP